MNYKSPQGTHSTLSTPEIPPVEFFGFPIVNTPPPPMPSEFHNREPPPLPFRNPKSLPWYGMDIFWNHPMTFCLTVAW